MNRKNEVRQIIAGVARQLTEKAMDLPPKEVARLVNRLVHYSKQLGEFSGSDLFAEINRSTLFERDGNLIKPGDPIQNARGETVGKAMSAAGTDGRVRVSVNATDHVAFGESMKRASAVDSGYGFSITYQGQPLIVQKSESRYIGGDMSKYTIHAITPAPDANAATEATIAAAIEWGMGKLENGYVPNSLAVRTDDPAGTEVYWVATKCRGTTKGTVTHDYGAEFVDSTFRDGLRTVSDSVRPRSLFSLPRLLAAYAKSKQPPAPAFKAGDRARHKDGATGHFENSHIGLVFVEDGGKVWDTWFSYNFTHLPPLPAGFKPMATAPFGRAIVIAIDGNPISERGTWNNKRSVWDLADGTFVSPEFCLGWQDFPKVEMPKP